jgi:hypothetical protein
MMQALRISKHLIFQYSEKEFSMPTKIVKCEHSSPNFEKKPTLPLISLLEDHPYWYKSLVT